MDHIQEGCIMKLRSLAAFLFAIFATITTLSGTAIAQGAYPEKPIRLVVGYPPAGGADSVARVVVEVMTRIIGQPILVDNKPGATTTIAAEIVARSAPDGYTLFIAQPFNYGIDKVFMKNVGYDGARDFTPVTQWVSAPLVLVVNNAFEATNVAQLIERARKFPGKYFYGSVGNGGVTHLAGVYFNDVNKTNIVHVPYKGGAQGAQGLIAGDVQLAFASGPTVMPLVNAGRLRALAVTSEKQSSVVPGVPSVAESGVKGFEIVVSFGLVGPAGLQPQIVKKLFDASQRSLAETSAIDKLAKLAIEAAPSPSPEHYRAYLMREGEKQAALARQSGATLD